MNGKNVSYSTAKSAHDPSAAVCRSSNCRGYTLIELMIVVSIIGILAAIAIPNYQWGIIKAKEAVLRESLFNFRNTIDQFNADQGKYPDSITELKEKGYLREIPKDPFTNSNTTWTTEPPPAGGSSGGGSGNNLDMSNFNLGQVQGSGPGNVYDVRSGSDKISPFTNTPYREW